MATDTNIISVKCGKCAKSDFYWYKVLNFREAVKIFYYFFILICNLNDIRNASVYFMKAHIFIG